MGLYLTVYEVTSPRATAGLRGVHATLAVVVLVRTALVMFGPARGTAGFQIREILLRMLQVQKSNIPNYLEYIV